MEATYFKYKTGNLFIAIYKDYGLAVACNKSEWIIQKKTDPIAVELMSRRFNSVDYIESSRDEFIDALRFAKTQIEFTNIIDRMKQKQFKQEQQ